MLEDRINELEIRLTFQEDQLEQLNQIISKQQLELAENRQLTKLFIERVKELTQASVDGGTEDNAPPHY